MGWAACRGTALTALHAKVVRSKLKIMLMHGNAQCLSQLGIKMQQELELDNKDIVHHLKIGSIAPRTQISKFSSTNVL